MKNLSLLMLTLVVALPGCCKRRNVVVEPVRTGQVEQYLDTTGVVDNDDESDMDYEEDEVDFKVDLDALEADIDDEEEYVDEDDIDSLEVDLGSNMDLNVIDNTDELVFAPWVDAQDDEMKKIYFSFNHFGVRADQQPSLQYDIQQIKQLVSSSDSAARPTIVVEGHTDQEGDRSYNFGLSEKRAKTVADLLVASGIDRSLIKVVGRGQECPIVINGRVIDGSREDRAPNRRVEVRVIYT